LALIRNNNYNSYGGCDITATITVPQLLKKTATGYTTYEGINPVFTIGELRTLTYSIHADDFPVRAVGKKRMLAVTSGPITIAGTLIFATFDRHVFRQISDSLKKRYHVLGDDNYPGSSITSKILANDLPPFDITITFQNEYGNASVEAIYGVHIVDEGKVMNIDDIMTETTMSYYALDILPMDYINKSQVNNNQNKLYDELANENFYPYVWVVWGKVSYDDGSIPESIHNYIIGAEVNGKIVSTFTIGDNGYYYGHCSEKPQSISLYHNGVLIETKDTTPSHKYNFIVES
jgi:hypothetical protein